MNHSLKRFNQFVTENEDRLGRLAQLGLTDELTRLEHRAASLVRETGESSIFIDEEDYVQMLLLSNSGFDYDYDLANWFSAAFDEYVLSSGSQADAIRMLGQEDLVHDEDKQMTEYEYEDACRRQMEYNWDSVYAKTSLEVTHTGDIRVHGEFFGRSGPDYDFNRLVPERGYLLDQLDVSDSDKETIYSDVVSFLEARLKTERNQDS